jgi:hypothetical protein
MTIGFLFWSVCKAWLLVACMDIAFLFLVRSGWIPHTSVVISLFLVLLIGATGLGLWKRIAWMAVHEIPTLSAHLQFAALCLYGAGSLVYMEIRSLLSRGYSLRILLDLQKTGGTSDMENLKSRYGGGMGISGLLRKRAATLGALHLIHYQEPMVGPLTSLGKVLALISSQARQGLKLDDVG